MNTHDDDQIKQLMQQSLPPVETVASPSRDLWPTVLRRLDANLAAATANAAPGSIRLFDWALLAGLVVFAVSFPATIPVFLYYL
jgi:hypothetical protein